MSTLYRSSREGRREVGTLAGLEKGVGYLKGEMRGHVILQRLMCLREKGIRRG